MFVAEVEQMFIEMKLYTQWTTKVVLFTVLQSENPNKRVRLRDGSSHREASRGLETQTNDH